MDNAVETPGKSCVRICQEGQHYDEKNISYECNYNCIFTWKIPKVSQKKLAAKNVLYSPPFYTGQNAGYKLRLFLYMDGDGSGKGTYLSFFIAVMRGEYDAQLTWPFKQKVTLILQDQDHLQQHIAKWFKPDPTEYNTSFHRPSPHSEMNIPAFGCPKFAPLSVLDNPSYVKDDTMMLRCIIDTTY